MTIETLINAASMAPAESTFEDFCQGRKDVDEGQLYLAWKAAEILNADRVRLFDEVWDEEETLTGT